MSGDGNGVIQLSASIPGEYWDNAETDLRESFSLGEAERAIPAMDVRFCGSESLPAAAAVEETTSYREVCSLMSNTLRGGGVSNI